MLNMPDLTGISALSAVEVNDELRTCSASLVDHPMNGGDLLSLNDSAWPRAGPVNRSDAARPASSAAYFYATYKA